MGTMMLSPKETVEAVIDIGVKKGIPYITA